MAVIFVTVRSGIAEVDESTVPDGVEVRVLDFDSLKQDPCSFAAELDEIDTRYLDENHPRKFARMTDAVNEAAEGEEDTTCLDCGRVLGPDHVCDEDEDDEFELEGSEEEDDEDLAEDGSLR